MTLYDGSQSRPRQGGSSSSEGPGPRQPRPCSVQEFTALRSVYPVLSSVSASTVLRQRTPQTGWLINNRHLILTDSEAEESKITAPADSVSVEGHFLVTLPDATAWCHWLSSRSGRDKGALWGLCSQGHCSRS